MFPWFVGFVPKLTVGPMAKERNIPALVTCPSCKRVMGIKSVTPTLRGTDETIEYVCPHCGTTQRSNTPRADNEGNHPA